jgi:hypothetical protein
VTPQDGEEAKNRCFCPRCLRELLAAAPEGPVS